MRSVVTIDGVAIPPDIAPVGVDDDGVSVTVGWSDGAPGTITFSRQEKDGAGGDGWVDAVIDAHAAIRSPGDRVFLGCSTNHDDLDAAYRLAAL